MSMNTSKPKIAPRAALFAGVLASNLVMLGAAQAQHFDGRGRGVGQHLPPPIVRHAPPVYHDQGHAPQHRHHGRGDGIARGVAIGVGALILGGILASEANRQRQYEQGEYDPNYDQSQDE